MLRFRMFFVGVLLGLAAMSSPVQAQWGDPFASLEYGVHPHCPFDCDSVTLVLSGELTSTSWNPPELMNWSRVGDSIDVRIRVVFNPDPALPVLVPFEMGVPLGFLAEGAYRVAYTISIDNAIATMPMVPFITITDKFVVAPPGDQNCDGAVNIGDVVSLINHAFRGGAPPDPLRRGDVNCDGTIDVLDVVRLIIHAFRSGTVCDPCTSPSPISLIGAWRWVRLQGGIAGVVLTPEIVGYQQRSVYGPDRSYEFYRDSTLLTHTTYAVVPGSPTDVSDGAVIHYVDPGQMSQMIVHITSDSLHLFDLCIDCFEWTFVRE